MIGFAGQTRASRVWFRFRLDLPTAHAVQGTSPPPGPGTGTAQTAYALDLTGMGKGVAYVNGFNLGRYSALLSLPGITSSRTLHCFDVEVAV